MRHGRRAWETTRFEPVFRCAAAIPHSTPALLQLSQEAPPTPAASGAPCSTPRLRNFTYRQFYKVGFYVAPLRLGS